MINLKKFFPLPIIIGSCIWDGGETNKGHKGSGGVFSEISNSQDEFYNDFDKKCLEGLKLNQELRIIPHSQGVNRFNCKNCYDVTAYNGDLLAKYDPFKKSQKYWVEINKGGQTVHLGAIRTSASTRLLQTEKNKFLWFLPCLDYRAEVVEQDGFLYPKKFYFTVNNSDNLEIINVDYEGIWTIYTYKNSVIYVNHEDATQDPFDMNLSHVNIEELFSLIGRLKNTNLLIVIKYFLDFMVYQNGTKMIYGKKDYFNIALEENSLLIDIDDGHFEKLKTELENLKKLLENKEGRNLHFTKLFVSFAKPGLTEQDLEKVPFELKEEIQTLPREKDCHVVLLLQYHHLFFIIDTNGYMPPYIGKDFTKAIEELNIKYCKNETFIQNDGNCDTAASVMSFLLSNYWKDNDYKLPLNEDNDIDFEKILDHAKPFYRELITFFHIPMCHKTYDDADK